MNIFIDGKKITRDFKQCMSFEHRGFTVSTAQGKELNFTETIVFLHSSKGFIPNEVDIPALHKQFSSIPEAIQAVDRLADAVEMGFITIEESEDA